MAILTNAQKQGLDALVSAKRKYDEKEEEVAEAARLLRNENKAVIREAVNVCIELGVPMRQIHMQGMGMGQVSQLTNFLAPPKAAGTRATIQSLAQGMGQPVGLVPVVREQKMPAVRNTGNNGLGWMEDGVECHVIWRQLTPEYGYISEFEFAKLSELGKQIVTAERTFKCLFTKDERDAFIKDSVIPDRFKD